MTGITLIFPHQLYQNHPALARNRPVVLVEEWLFFRQYAFHKQKLILHRASMKFYEQYLVQQGYTVEYINAIQPNSDVRALIQYLGYSKAGIIHYADTTDNWLEKRIHHACRLTGLQKEKYPSPNFLNTPADVQEYIDTHKTYFQTDFYIGQRKQRKILLEPNGQPVGGKWSYDAENRLKIPATEIIPPLPGAPTNKYVTEATAYVQQHFPDNPGSAGPPFGNGHYPVTYAEAEAWLDNFIENRFQKFGIYQDAMLQRESFLFHSVLTPMLNTGLLQPQLIIQKAIDALAAGRITLNSAEGFIRQIMGWREFVRVLYEQEGSRQRTKNHWGFSNPIPKAFYTGNTGMAPVDAVIKRTLRCGYAHHIERLMVMGNFMLLCEISPDEVYRWFMEMYVDAYDWVMVPNVYGMSQYADGGLMATKPYISSSNYLFKLGDWKKLKAVNGIQPWNDTWDALFWRFMHVHRDLLSANPRLGMLLKTFDKMPRQKQQQHLAVADAYLEQLHA
jgi:deoxyribodipyrimidine photolyase-related protein